MSVDRDGDAGVTGTGGSASTGADDADGEIDVGQIPDETREDVKDRDGFQCQLCSACGPEVGGVAVLHVHHKSNDPVDCGYHDEENLITLCRQCHSWFHNRPTGDDVPVVLSADAEEELLTHDYEILQVVAAHGPVSTTEVAEHLSTEHSTSAVRDRLCVLMGLDTVVDSQTTQVIDQDAHTDEWGLCDDISRSKRGRIPEDRTTLIQRVEDERVRRALARGQSRADVADAFDLTARTTWYKQRRAQAYAFPLDAFTQGRPSVLSDTGGEVSEVPLTDGSTDAGSTGDNESKLVAASAGTANDDGDGEGDRETVGNGSVSTSGGKCASERRDDGEVDASVQASLQEAISALKNVEQAL